MGPKGFQFVNNSIYLCCCDHDDDDDIGKLRKVSNISR